jgi:intracellular septation protein
MKLLFDLFPLILFFAAFKLADIYVATAVAIGASIAQIAWLRLRKRPIEPMQWASLIIIVVFGGMTLVLRDETFIKWKPTVLYLSFALALGVARWALRRNLIAAMMGGQIRLPPVIWDRMNLAWVVFFAAMAVLNLYVAYNFSTDLWVNFKAFGTLALTVLFVIGQAFYMARHAEQQEDQR